MTGQGRNPMMASLGLAPQYGQLGLGQQELRLQQQRLAIESGPQAYLKSMILNRIQSTGQLPSEADLADMQRIAESSALTGRGGMAQGIGGQVPGMTGGGLAGGATPGGAGGSTLGPLGRLPMAARQLYADIQGGKAGHATGSDYGQLADFLVGAYHQNPERFGQYWPDYLGAAAGFPGGEHRVNQFVTRTAPGFGLAVPALAERFHSLFGGSTDEETLASMLRNAQGRPNVQMGWGRLFGVPAGGGAMPGQWLSRGFWGGTPATQTPIQNTIQQPGYGY
jgi:hypothetical protein